MGDNYIGEIRLFAFAKIPMGWAPCDGSVLQIKQNYALYSLLGVQFGGDGVNTFGLPDLRGRTPIHMGRSSLPPNTTYVMGAHAGVEGVQLTVAQTPNHQHTLCAVPLEATSGSDVGNMLGVPTATSGAVKTPHPIYGLIANPVQLHPSTLSPAGGSATHTNMQPFAVLNFCIATEGVYPPRAQ